MCTFSCRKVPFRRSLLADGTEIRLGGLRERYKYVSDRNTEGGGGGAMGEETYPEICRKILKRKKWHFLIHILLENVSSIPFKTNLPT